MQQGASFKDTDGLSWTVHEPLGQGSLARAWLVRSEDGRDAVLKVALTKADIAEDTPVPDGLDKAAKAALLELGELLKAGDLPFFPRLLDIVDLAPGKKRKTPKEPGLLLHRYPTTLAKELGQGAPVGKTLRILARVLDQIEALRKTKRIHGNLRPENILLNEAGEPVLADPITPAAAPLRTHFATLSGRPSLLPPEADEPAEADDAFAMCAMAWLGAMAQPGTDPRHIDSLTIPVGIDKVGLAAVRDAALGSLKRGNANTRFTTRVAERLGALLSRGLSEPVEPSPPYRFLTIADLAPRLREVAGLVDPRVAEVGKVLLAAAADKHGVFQGGEAVAFSVSCGSTSGQIGHEDIAVGLQVLDRDADGDARVRVPGTQFDVSAHPSGRLRFSFTLPELAPGRYEVRVAFSIKDSGHDPTVAQGEFEVRPPPGYVPPEPEPEPDDAPLKLPSRPKPAPAPALPEPEDDAPSAPDAEVVPLPIAPSSPGIAPIDPGVPPSDPGVREDERARPTPAETEADRTVPALQTPRPMDDPGTGPDIVSPPPVARPKPVVSLSPPPLDPPAPAPAAPQPTPPPALTPKPTGVPIGEQKTQPRVNPPPAQPTPPPVQGPGTWEADLPNPTPQALPPQDYLPGQNLDELGEDLPTWDGGGSGLPPAVQKVVDVIKNDPFTAVAAVALGGAILAAAAMLLMG